MRPCSSLSGCRYAHDFAARPAAVPAGVDVIVLEQSGVEEILWQDFSHTEELLEQGLSRRARRARSGREADRRTSVGRARPRDGGPVRACARRSREESLVRTVRLD